MDDEGVTLLVRVDQMSERPGFDSDPDRNLARDPGVAGPLFRRGETPQAPVHTEGGVKMIRSLIRLGITIALVAAGWVAPTPNRRRQVSRLWSTRQLGRQRSSASEDAISRGSNAASPNATSKPSLHIDAVAAAPRGVHRLRLAAG